MPAIILHRCADLEEDYGLNFTTAVTSANASHSRRFNLVHALGFTGDFLSEQTDCITDIFQLIIMVPK